MQPDRICCQLKTKYLIDGSELNIEATAFNDDFLYLFNRANNLVVRFNYQDFLGHLKGGKVPKVEVCNVNLPNIQGVEPGFSGATFLKNSEIIFTASVEATNNAYDDGKIIGSLVGILDVSDFHNVTVSHYGLIPNGKQPLKVESVAVKDLKSDGNIEAIFITDDDNGNTEFLRVQVQK